MGELLTRLAQWNAQWTALVAALHRDSKIPSEFTVVPWLFIPDKFVEVAQEKLKQLPVAPAPSQMPTPRFFPLEAIVPWNEARVSLRAAEPECLAATTT
jgi:hypothetical protein